MNPVVYYFSGTGNSLDIAQRIAKKLDGKLLPMVASLNSDLDHPDQTVGLIYPTYMYRPPRLVVDFIQKLQRVGYAFVVTTRGGDGGDVLTRSKNLLAKRRIPMGAAFSLKMPDNYLPWGQTPDVQEQKQIIDRAHQSIEGIVQTVQNKGTHMDNGSTWFKETVHPAMLYRLGYAMIPTSDKSFFVNDNCAGCKSCAKVCPTNNINMVDARPTWGGNCQQCLACAQWCNKMAIEVNKKSPGYVRYHHPDIKRRQIISQKTLSQ